MKAIVAVDKNWGIGKKNDLLFSLPKDMEFFRKTTLNKVVVMGSNTLKSIRNHPNFNCPNLEKMGLLHSGAVNNTSPPGRFSSRYMGNLSATFLSAFHIISLLVWLYCTRFAVQ